MGGRGDGQSADSLSQLLLTVAVLLNQLRSQLGALMLGVCVAQLSSMTRNKLVLSMGAYDVDTKFALGFE